MSKFTLEINCDNAAFRDQRGSRTDETEHESATSAEVGRILIHLGRALANGTYSVGYGSWALYDANGNTVGQWLYD